MSPLAPYRRLFALAGPSYVLVAFLGRLPLAMSQMGTLLLVSTATGSYGSGGAAAGALAVANAVGAPGAAAAADRLGQRVVVLVQSVLGSAGLVALVAAAGSGTPADGGAGTGAGVGVPALPLIVLAAATGLVLPQVGPLARVRWRPIIGGAAEGRRLRDAAFSYEGAADEASFVLGPALVGVAAATVSPAGALVTAAALLVVFGSAFALHRTARLVRAAHADGDGGRLLSSALLVLIGAQTCIGALFGATQTGTTVLATEHGQPGVAGLVHAALGVGSVLAGLGTAFVPERIGHARRWLVAAGALVVLAVPLLAVGTIPMLVVVVSLLGLAVAPYMIAVFTLGERIVPAARTGTALTLLAAATGLGYAVGSSVAGRLGDTHGWTASFAVTVVATVAAVVLAATQQRRVERAVVRGDAAEAAAENPLRTSEEVAAIATTSSDAAGGAALGE